MEINKMRCHFSIIFEKTGSFLIFWLAIAVTWIDDISDALLAGNTQTALYVCGGLFLLLLLVMGYQFLVWRKTFIYIDGDTFVVERNTLNRQKSTFGIANIANINLEQNLFERIIGTYRLKLDTDSFSTASTTDVSIVLSSEKAKRLKNELLSLMKKDAASPDTETLKESEVSKELCVPYASFKEVLSHCFYNISTVLLFLALIIVVGFPLLFHFGDVSFWDMISEGDTSFSGRFLAILFLVLTYGYSLIKQLFSFYRFCCFRQGNDLIIRYGFFRKQDFTIPIDRINAIQILQPPLARLTGRIQARLICIGLGDSENEKPQLTLCMKKKEFYARLQELLPEFSTESVQTVHKLPKGSGMIHLLSCLLLLVCFSAAFWMTALSTAEDDSALLFLVIIYGIVFCLIVLYRLLHYFSMGTHLGTEQLVIHDGAFQKHSWIIPYRKIQYVEFNQNPLHQLYGIKKGTVYILASLGNNILTLPLIRQTDVQKLQKELLR